MEADVEVRNQPERSRYELLLGGVVIGIAEYHETETGVVVFPHTVIEAAHRGRGHGAQLVRAALDDVRRTGRTIVPACWYVAQFVGENPEYRDLLAA